MLIIYQEDQNHQFIRLGGPNVTIKIQGDQNHGFEKLRGPKSQFSLNLNISLLFPSSQPNTTLGSYLYIIYFVLGN